MNHKNQFLEAKPQQPRKPRKPADQKKTVHANTLEGDYYEKLSFDLISSVQNQQSDEKANEDLMVHVDVQIPGSRRPAELHCKVDTRAQGNVLPMRTFKKMFPNHVNNQGLPVKLVEQRPYLRLDAYNGTEIPQHGVIKLKIKIRTCQQPVVRDRILSSRNNRPNHSWEEH